MAANETHGLGYEQVDDDPHVAVLTDTMDATARWDAAIELRAWEREHLRLRIGQRLLDVGCGLGDAALALGDDLGGTGEVVGVDASTEMLRVARSRSNGARCQVRWSVGDALALDEPDNSFDVVRCERTLQWLADPSVAVAEMARVVRPGGRISLIDTDWSTFRVDIGDDDVDSRIREALRIERNRPSNVGSRLSNLIRDGGLQLLAETNATQIWTDWDPDESPAPAGCFSMRSLADDLVDTGQLEPGETERFVSAIHDAARHDRFSMSLTMFAVVAESGKITA
jgi:SAM-dependent methyltransferase